MIVCVHVHSYHAFFTRAPKHSPLCVCSHHNPLRSVLALPPSMYLLLQTQRAYTPSQQLGHRLTDMELDADPKAGLAALRLARWRGQQAGREAHKHSPPLPASPMSSFELPGSNNTSAGASPSNRGEVYGGEECSKVSWKVL